MRQSNGALVSRAPHLNSTLLGATPWGFSAPQALPDDLVLQGGYFGTLDRPSLSENVNCLSSKGSPAVYDICHDIRS